jgi:tyrosinase
LGYSYDTDPVGPQPQIIELTIGAPPTQASIGQSGENDMYRFVVPTAGSYTIETQGPTDVVMSLFGPNSQTALVTEDDDSGQDRNARIVSNLTAGTYYVRVRHFNPRSTGNYSISVQATAAQPSIPELQVNGPATQGNIAAANESDLYTFAAGVTGLYTIETAGNTDTFLTLFGPNSQTRLIAQDDDSGPGFNSRIVANLTAGVYFARVRHYRPTGTGPYSISVRR